MYLDIHIQRYTDRSLSLSIYIYIYVYICIPYIFFCCSHIRRLFAQVSPKCVGNCASSNPPQKRLLDTPESHLPKGPSMGAAQRDAFLMTLAPLDI